MKTIVFGGSGFLGSHVADVLSERGFDVTIFDIRESSYLNSGQKMLQGDIMDKAMVEKAVRGADFVYNFAGIADLDDANTKAQDTISLNIAGNLNIIEACVKAKVKRFIYASSVYVYSHKGGFYRCSKQSSEIYIEEYQRRYGLDFSILRYGTLYGPRANENNSINRYLRHALEEAKISVDGKGEELREYLHVRDAARLSVDILADEYLNQHIIVTGHHPTKFKDMLMLIREMLNKDVKIEFTGTESENHYSYTPYSFIPKIGRKLVCNYYTDMGQGFLECLNEITENKKVKA